MIPMTKTGTHIKTSACLNLGNDFIPHCLLLQWHVTDQCNGNCTHCYQDPRSSSELSITQMFGILKQYLVFLEDCSSRLSGTPVSGHINITGGEPFIRKDILDLLDMVATYRDRFSFGILTNGTLIDRRMARYLRFRGPRFVQVSLEGGRETHDRIRGQGNFESVVEGIRNLVRYGIRTLVSFTAYRDNYREFPQVVRLARRMNVAGVWTDRFIPLGQAKNQKTQALTAIETRDYVNLVARTRLEQPPWPRRQTRVDARRALQFLGHGGRPYHCTAGSTLLALLPDGSLLPCRRMPIVIGNVLDVSLADLYWQSQTLHDLRQPGRIITGCTECEHLNNCGGGLHCLSYALHDNPFQADPGCWIAQCAGV